MIKEKIEKRMRELGIFQNKTQISKDEMGITMIHQDDMPVYNSWHLIEFHRVDNVVWRGQSKNIPQKYKEFLPKIGNPANVIVTQSAKDTY